MKFQSRRLPEGYDYILTHCLQRDPLENLVFSASTNAETDYVWVYLKYFTPNMYNCEKTTKTGCQCQWIVFVGSFAKIWIWYVGNMVIRQWKDWVYCKKISCYVYVKTVGKICKAHYGKQVLVFYSNKQKSDTLKSDVNIPFKNWQGLKEKW